VAWGIQWAAAIVPQKDDMAKTPKELEKKLREGSEYIIHPCQLGGDGLFDGSFADAGHGLRGPRQGQY